MTVASTLLTISRASSPGKKQNNNLPRSKNASARHLSYAPKKSRNLPSILTTRSTLIVRVRNLKYVMAGHCHITICSMTEPELFILQSSKYRAVESSRAATTQASRATAPSRVEPLFLPNTEQRDPNSPINVVKRALLAQRPPGRKAVKEFCKILASSMSSVPSLIFTLHR